MLLLRRTLTSQNRYCVSQYRYLSSKLPTAQANSSNLKGFNIDNNDMFDKNRVSVRGFGDTCFVVNDAMIEQSIILLPHNVLLWNVKKFEDITIDSLSIFPLLFPTIETLFIGCGEVLEQQFPLEIVKHFREKGIVIEASDSVSAASTFNILNGEGRNVAAALLTKQPWSPPFE